MTVFYIWHVFIYCDVSGLSGGPGEVYPASSDPHWWCSTWSEHTSDIWHHFLMLSGIQSQGGNRFVIYLLGISQFIGSVLTVFVSGHTSPKCMLLSCLDFRVFHTKLKSYLYGDEFAFFRFIIF